MPQRLTPLEVSILHQDTVRTPAHVGTVLVLEPPVLEPLDSAANAAGFDHADLLALVAERIAYVPRYRQRVLGVPGRLAAPVWVDDTRFDLAYHVRRAVLPAPGAWAQLEEFVARVLTRRLDRSRALWELYLVEGLEGGRTVVVGKTHLALVDNLDTVDLAQVLIDSMAQPVPAASDSSQTADGWLPLPEPSPMDLVGAALWESAQDPEAATTNLRGAVTSALGLGLAVGEVLVGGPTGVSQLAEDLLGRGPQPTSPLAGPVSGQRSWASVRLSLDDITAVATAHVVTAHDVVLATVAGALRSWLLGRGQLVGSEGPLRSLAPVSVREAEGVLSSLGSEVAPQLVPLPIGTEDPLERLRAVAAATVATRDVERAVGARELAEIPGFAPATLHVLGARQAAEPGRPPFDLLVTNVPGPQGPLFLGPAPLVETYPVAPLPPGQLLSIALTSYQGGVFCGVLADREAVDDLAALTQGLVAALAELPC